jgi:putative transposase
MPVLPLLPGRSAATTTALPVEQRPFLCGQVNAPQTEAELKEIRQCLRRGSPFGTSGWVELAAEQLGLQATLRARGRPFKRSS